MTDRPRDPFEDAADEEFSRARERVAPTQRAPDDERPPTPIFGRTGNGLERQIDHTAPASVPDPVAAPREFRPPAHPSGPVSAEDDPTGERFRHGEFSNDPGWFEPGPRNAQLCYWLNLGGFVISPLPLVGAAIAFTNRRKVGAGLATHYTYAMRTALLAILYGLVLSVLFGRSVGPALIVVVVWFAWRNLKGLSRCGSGRPIDDPRSWFG